MKKTFNKKVLLIAAITIAALGSMAVTKSEFFRQLEKSQKLYHWVNREVLSRYVDDIDIEEFTKKSIQGMLSELDPYTVYLEAEERDGLDMLTKGKYGGVGIQLGQREEVLTVIAPMENTPAQRAGIISGDKIIAIDSTKTKDMNISDAAKLIRGEEGTEVILTIERYGEEELIDFSLVRADIKVKDVSYSGMINDNTAYIRLTRFSKNAALEVRQALKKLDSSKPESIILDLRDNPGGLLQASIGILDLFTDRGEVLLKTKGKADETNRTFKSEHHPMVDRDVKLAVLINGGSASASEIVAGAIQDLDRGVVLGKRSFGKGLVQTVYNFDRKRSLKITTAKYYIPSGRLIQKPDYNNEDIIAWTAVEDTAFTTAGGRKVKGGGGIHPDIEASWEKPGTLVQECWRKGLFFTFVQQYRDKFETPDDVVIDDELLANFQEFLNEHDMNLPISGESQLETAYEKLSELDSTNAELHASFGKIREFISEQENALFYDEREQIRIRLRAEFGNLFDGTAGRIAISIQDDPVVQKAVEVLESGNSYSEVFVVK